MAENLKTIMWLFIGRAVERNASSPGSFFQTQAIPPIRAENPQRRDSLAERGELELPVSISEQPEDNMKSGSAAPKRSVGIARGSKRPVSLYDRQHLKEALPRAHERHRD
jgi:hypothetical protein